MTTQAAAQQPNHVASTRGISGSFDAQAQGIASLLRDADAKCYSTARAAGKDPSISIRLSNDGVHVECNHDRYSAVAARQSDANEDRCCHFYPHSDGEDGNRRRHNLVLRLQAIHGTVLLSLDNLRCIKITVMDQLGKQVWSREAQVKKEIMGTLAVLNTVESKITPPPKKNTTSRYHIMWYTPPVENPINSDIKGSNRVMLAFPVADDGNPMTEKQDLHTVTPIRKGPFNKKFLVYANFPLSSSGDMIQHSLGDWKLRQAIVDALIKAIKQISLNPTMRYKWIRYLPRKADVCSDPFWREDTASMFNALLRLPLLSVDSGGIFGKLCSVSQLRRLGEDQVDSSGHPLFPDLKAETLYLSVKYERKDADILADYGLETAQTKDLMPRLRALVESKAWNDQIYLDRHEDWQSRVARWILRAWEDGRQEWRDALKTMKLIPLTSGQFRSPADTTLPVYFPDIDGTPIPHDVPLDIVLPAAAANPDCRKLYQALGVVSADSATIKALLAVKQTPTDEVSKTPSVSKSDAHLMHPGDDMFNDETSDLTLVWLSLAKDRPEHFLLRLHKDFSHPAGRKGWLSSEDKAAIIRETEITCSNGVTRLICETFLPLPALLTRCERWLSGEPDKTLPFVKLEKPLTGLSHNDEVWTELARHFDMRADDDLDFTLAILEAVMAEDVRPKRTLSETVLGCYLRLFEQSNGTEDNALERVRSWFSDNPGVLCTPQANPSTDGAPHTPEWTFPTECRWSAIPGSTSSAQYTLKDVWDPVIGSLNRDDSRNLERFFRDVLRIWNVPYVDIEEKLDALTALAEQESGSHALLFEGQATVRQLYKELEQLTQEADDPALNVIRNAFKDMSLIYVPSAGTTGKRWFRTSECVWESGAVLISNVPCLESTYPDFSRLFVDTLQVSGLDFLGVLQQLATVRTNKTILSVSQAKKLLQSLNGILPPVPDTAGIFNTTGHRDFDTKAVALRNEIIDCSIFPVRMQDKSVRLMSSSDEFFIPDGHTCVELLRDSVDILDFDVDTVRRLYPLLQAAGLSDKYMSQSIYITGKASIARIYELDQKLSSTICRRAAVWTSIAAHFKSPRVSEGTSKLHHTLKDLRVFAVSKPMPTSATARGKEDSPLRIEEGLSGKLKMYIPAASEYFDDREYCLASRLPLELAAYLMQCESNAVDSQIVCIVGSILQVKPITALRILRDKGIDFLGPDFEEAALRADQLDFNTSITPAKKNIKVRVRLPPTGTTAPKETEDKSPPAKIPTLTHNSPPSLDELLGMRYPPRIIPVQKKEQLDLDPAYSDLLNHVVTKARVTQLPYECAAYDMSTLFNAIDRDSTTQLAFSFKSDDQTDWQRMVGAAGELFTFELLLALKPKLPSFSRDNWQSVVRHFATAHSEYANLTKKNGREQSDIFYSDSMSLLTALFIQRGYLDETWRGATPDYYIEVKTTMRNLEKAFYMSSDQFDLMQTMNQSQAYQKKKQLYVIFRVYGLHSGNIGLKVYADPMRAKEEQRLDFQWTNDSWVVTPQTHPKSQTPGFSTWAPSSGTGTTFNFGGTFSAFGASSDS
ncbi:hypothetical protein QQX98_009200 [Neonectria punicea]|uniref:Protein NO VEIN C-terminal domain-containing protein n=1 Tax=Neonectria punicea TaxID=979145 RepID=A0ABR1GT64_9HYPO